MKYYSDYFTIKENYSPCMNKKTINKSPDRWLDFYPHESFVELLRTLLQNLDGGNQSVWLAAAYGTGKSHAALVLQKLFMDDESRVNQWLEKRNKLIPDVCKNMLKKMREKVLVVFDSNSDGINEKEQFLVRIQSAIMAELEERHLNIPVMGQKEQILQRVAEEGD